MIEYYLYTPEMSMFLRVNIAIDPGKSAICQRKFTGYAGWDTFE